MIGRPKLILMFFIYFLVCFVTVSYEKAVFRESRRQVERIDNAFLPACRRAGEALKNHIYEEDVEEMVRQTFLYTYASMLGAKDKYDILAESADVEQITFFVNGENTPADRLTTIKDSDVLELHIALKDICINAFGRKKYISRNFAEIVR